MKNQLFIIAACGVLLLAGCKPDNGGNEPQQTLSGNVAAPAWVAPAEYDYSTSLTAVVRVNLAAQYPQMAKDFVLNDADLLAAFAGNECIGLASPTDGLFYLYVVAPAVNDEQAGAVQVTLRYYSTHYKNLFEAKDALTFRNDEHLGTYAAPLEPAFVVVN